MFNGLISPWKYPFKCKHIKVKLIYDKNSKVSLGGNNLACSIIY